MKNHNFYTAFGYLTCAFAEMEADLRILISGVAFNDNAITASAFLDNSQLNANISILRKLAKQYWEHDTAFTDIAQKLEQLRPVRNQFIHGLWKPGKRGDVDRLATVQDLKTSYEEEGTSRIWKHGQHRTYSIAEFDSILKDIHSVTASITVLCKVLEEDEDLDFKSFGSTSKGKPVRMRIRLDGLLEEPRNRAPK
jgi:hypothetical protein